MLLPEFSRFLGTRKSKETQDKYLNAAHAFLGYLTATHTNLLDAPTSAVVDFNAFLQTEEDGTRSASVATARLMSYGVKAYLNFLKTRVRDLPSFDLRPPKQQPKTIARAMSERQLIAYLTGAEKEEEPLATVLALMPFCGLKLSEFRDLTLASWAIADRDGETIRYVFHVGEKEKAHPVPLFTGPNGAVSAMFAQYLESFRPLWDSDQRMALRRRWMFPGSGVRGGVKQISERQIEAAMARVRKAMAIDVTPHICRMHYIAALLGCGCDNEEAAVYAGNMSPRTLITNYSTTCTKDTDVWMGTINRPMAKKVGS